MTKIDGCNRVFGLSLSRKMTPESRKFRFSSWTFLDKRFVELDAEKAEFSENRGFVALHCFALQKQTFFGSKSDFQSKFMVFENFFGSKCNENHI